MTQDSKSNSAGTTALCALSGKELEASNLIKGSSIRPLMFELIKKDHPEITLASYFSDEELIHYRRKYLEKIIAAEAGELSGLEKQVVDYITKNSILSENIELSINDKLTPGQKVADQIADFGGSWFFITLFFTFIAIWMCINIFALTQKTFDPYPFILLNLILSCIAAIQAPIIMMSQNRKEHKDRQRSEHDYKVNLKAELEIRLLHEKIDHLMVHQNQRLIEIQELQTDFLEDILSRISKKDVGQ